MPDKKKEKNQPKLFFKSISSLDEAGATLANIKQLQLELAGGNQEKKIKQLGVVTTQQIKPFLSRIRHRNAILRQVVFLS